ANTAIFSLLNAVMLQSIPVHNPQELVVLRWKVQGMPKVNGHTGYGDCARGQWSETFATSCSFSYPMLKEFREAIPAFSGVAAFAGPTQLDLSGNGQASIVSTEIVSGDFFQTLGVGAAAGRTIEPRDEKPGAEAVAVLSYTYWRNAFGGRADAVGS